MGAIREMLNTLGYDKFSGESSNDTAGSITNHELVLSQTIIAPVASASDGICAGCELSARYF
jgi:hypothetical protein